MDVPRYFGFGPYLRDRFGERVHKVSIDAGFTCPNIDGLKGTGGCSYCNNSGFSFNTRAHPEDAADAVLGQVRGGIEALRKRFKAKRFMAYFQAFSNTYAPVDRLRQLYDAALQPEEVIALSVGTRSDCVSSAVLDLLELYTDRYEVWIEYGLQTSHDRTLKAVNRCELFEDFMHAIEMTAKRNLKICVHLILGLPGESQEDMLLTAERLGDIPYHGLKLHILHVMRNTRMAEELAEGRIPLMDRETYVDTVVKVLERIRPHVSLQRMTADAPPDILLAPQWCMDKNGIRRDIESELERRDTWQGKALGFPLESVGDWRDVSQALAAST